MPVILPPEARDAWLDPASDTGLLQSLLCPYPAEAMTCRQVNPALNNARNEGRNASAHHRRPRLTDEGQAKRLATAAPSQ